MGDPPRRKRLQVHLSTAVVLMFAAGALIGLNVRGSRKVAYSGDLKYPTGTVAGNLIVTEFGWPFRAFTYFDVSWLPGLEVKNFRSPTSWEYSGVVIDACAALAILFAVWFVSERWIAWRAGRKKTESEDRGQSPPK